MKIAIPFVAFFREAGTWPVAEQRRVCEAWAKQHGFKITSVYDATEIAGSRDQLVDHVRSHEGVIVAALWLIAEPGKGALKPTADQTRALGHLEQRARIVVEASTGITSMDKGWPDRKAEAIHYIAVGKRRISPRPKRVVKKPSKRAAPGTADRWRDPANAAMLAKWQTHWTSRKFATAEDAYNALPNYVRDQVGSLRQMSEIFGPRHMGDKRAGGRPRKQK